MLKRLTPFFNTDESMEGGWNDVFTQSEDSADEDQPVVESDAEMLEESEVPEEQDEVEPDSEEQEEQEEQPAFNDDTEIDLGEGRQPVKFAELKQGYMRQSDYTKKTQELATQRTELDAERQSIEPYKGWTDFINGNPWLMQQVNAAIQEFQSTGVLPLQEALADAQYGQYINTLLADNQKLTKENQSLQSKYGDLEFGTTMDKAIAELRDDYGDLITTEYEQELRDQAKAEGLKPDMVKRMAKGDLAEKKAKQNTKTAKEIEAETIQKLQEKRNALPANPKSKGQKPQVQTKSIEDASWAELLQGSG